MFILTRSCNTNKHIWVNTHYDVLLIEFDSHLGGIINNSDKINSIDNQSPKAWVKETVEAIEHSKNIRILKNTLVTTYNYINHLIAVEDKFVGAKPSESKVNSALHKIRTEHVLLCNGHIERFLSFQNNNESFIEKSQTEEDIKEKLISDFNDAKNILDYYVIYKCF